MNVPITYVFPESFFFFVALAAADPELEQFRLVTAEMKKSAKPDISTLRRWSIAYKAMCATRHLPGRRDKTFTLNNLVTGTSFSTAQK